MTTLTIRVNGEKVDRPAPETTDTLTLDEVYVVGATSRGEPAKRSEIKLDDTKIIEFTYTDNTVWLGDHTSIDEIFPGTSAQVRNLQPGQEAIVDIPTELTVNEPGRSTVLAQVALKLVKIFIRKNVDEASTPDLDKVVNELAGTYETRQLEKRSGLYRLRSDSNNRFTFTDMKSSEVRSEPDGKYVLFIHGTASSTKGSFSDLIGTPVWTFLSQTYGNNVLAFEHESLTKSPLENVLDLVRLLPAKATLTLISHSRGGLVGDILNRYCVDDPALRGFSAKEKNYLRRQGRDADLVIIEAIESAILGKNITIEKFIRVACTASGTTLASRRLDIYFNVIFNLIGLATAQLTDPVYVAFKDLLTALIETKDDASVLPGLEMQRPASPFNQMLNNAAPEVLINTPLLVIAGDATLSRQWSAIRVALSNLFFWGANDFVVDTRSMYNGAKRAAGKVQYFFDESVEVSHFSYFKNERTRNALFLALKSQGDTLIPGFARLETRDFTEFAIRNIDLSLPGGRVFKNDVSGKRPIVVLLPGIMGSTLTVSDNLVWINFLSFIGGGLTQLLYSDDNNPNVRADALVGSSYKKLTDYLARDYDVVTFPFDWRVDMATNAEALNRKLRTLMDVQQPIKLIGHSMGGVLIRDFMVNHTDTWVKLNASNGFRLIFLGSPLQGSFRIPYVLFGLDSLINTLDLIDISNSQKDLLTIFSHFPGILSLLPLTTDPDNDFAAPAVWETMREAFGDAEWPTPDEESLRQFKTYRDHVLAHTDSIDYRQATYIAGQSRPNQQTISGYQINRQGRKPTLEFMATKEGDESVTWDSGIPGLMLTQNTVYYSDVPHGELANDPKLFGAITDLLNTGVTTQLKRTRPVVRSLEKTFTARATFDFDLSPRGVEATVMGLGSPDQPAASDVPITVSVSNGDLKYALYPLMAGHFDKDGILSAEKVIDIRLGGELSRRHRLGQYPGGFGTSETVESGNLTGFKGAVVIGLGQQGSLTEFRLTGAIEHGATNYLIALNSRPTPPTSNGTVPKRIGLSTLLIGSGYGGLRIENAIRAIIQGVQNANAKVRQVYMSPKTIECIEFVELYRDRALACVKAIGALESEAGSSLTIFRSGNKIKQLIGWRERLPMDDTTEWWTRINVSQYGEEDDVTPVQRRSLRFSISTDAARVEERPLRTLDDTLSNMLEDLSRNGNWSPGLAKAIFELMVPNDFKDQVKRQNNINWILDKYTAAFPWELLQDNLTNARPLSVNAGMIRQLATGDFRININPVVERTVLVVGDPELSNPVLQLPAAYTEGQKVIALFGAQGFDVNPLLKSTAEQILLNLFSQTYKVLHLAGHGVFNSDPAQPTGMLIGRDAFLTPAHIDQMSSVPELVFINCCYLGQTDGTSEELTRSRFRLAANLGTQLIEIGVKAVVVAGWAVNDAAALDFAEHFYESLFDNYNFGESIKRARKLVFEKYGLRNNTWGAYQCYGDPFYRLSGEVRKLTETYTFIIPEEAEIELSNLLRRVESGGFEPETIIQTMDAIDRALLQAGLQSGRIIELQALLYSALNKYDLAIQKFDKLWKEERATFSFAATEQYCNVRVKRYALQAKDNPDLQQDAINEITKAAADLESLSRFGMTVERTSILASTYKRLAFLSDYQTDEHGNNPKRDTYGCAASWYRKSYDIPGNRSAFYPLTNWLAIEQALVLEGGQSWKKNAKDKANKLPTQDEAVQLIEKQLELIQQESAEEKDHWNWMAEPTLLLGKRLLGDTHVTEEQITSAFTTACQFIASQDQLLTEQENLLMLIDAFGMSTSDKALKIVELLTRLKQALAGLM